MNTKPKAHGLDGSLVAPDWPPLTLAEVRALLGEFPACYEPKEILFASPRPFSAAGVVATRSAQVFIKRHHRLLRDREGLLEEHRFIAHLRKNGGPVPEVLPANSGETAIEFGEWTYEVHMAPDGVDLYRHAQSWTPFRSVQHAYSAGRALARLVGAARGFDAPARNPHPLIASFTIFANSNPDAAFKQYLAARPALAGNRLVLESCEEALRLLAPFHAEILPLLPSLSPLWTHNDLHASNLFWSDLSPHARATAIIDFGLADRTSAVHDLAHAIERNIVGWLELLQHPTRHEAVPVHYESLHALLGGFESVRPLRAEEAAALAPLLALCHAEFALSEADYFLGVLHSQEQARMAVPNYLLDHAHWFRSRSGSQLLDELRRWADVRGRLKVAPQ
jgi:Ser/Thr protein kinase RdoA (MazF antagonist)